MSGGGGFFTRKCLSTPGRFDQAVVTGVRDLLDEHGVAPERVRVLAHATTVATNAVLEGRGPRTGLITTQGFRDVLELRRMRFPDMYNLFWEKPRPIVERHLRLEVAERMAADGTVVAPLACDDVEAVLERLVEGEGIETLAVCLLHAYANPAHEAIVGEIARARYPDLPVSLSSEVLPEIREYERTSTTVLNAYLVPVVRSYLETLERKLRALGIAAPILVMQSGGGIMSLQAAAAHPVHLLESGPAAGVVGAVELLRRHRLADAVTFDMGGTTAKSAMIEDGEPFHASEYEVGAPISIASRVLKGGGYLLRVLSIDVAEIGAGGGSIVHVDAGGALRVGPHSAAAEPGPCCYGKGGTEATVTDCNVVLGLLNPHALLGGALPIACDRAVEAVERVAKAVGLSTIETAYGVFEIANASMSRAIRAVSSERGRDLRNCTLVVFGGNGPVHAAALARSLGIARVLVPASSGVFSAAGLLRAPMERYAAETVAAGAGEDDTAAVGGAFEAMSRRLREEMALEGWRDGDIRLDRFVDLRYRGQSHELRVAVPAGPFDAIRREMVIEAFESEHRRTYGHAHTRSEIELRTLRVRGRVDIGTADLPRRAGPRAHAAGSRPIYFGPVHGLCDTPVLARGELKAASGPFVIEEYDTTVVVPPGSRAHLDDFGNILIEIG